MGAAMRVAYTVEQCWHEVPGGTAVAAIRIARELQQRPDDIDLRFVAGKHSAPPAPMFRPTGAVAMLPIGRPLLYETWTRTNSPKVEAVTGAVDLVHATGLIPSATSVPLVVTVHDLAFLHTPEKFTRHGARLMTRSVDVIKRRAARVICSSQTTFDDCVAHGFDRDQLRLVPLGVETGPATARELDDARRVHELPDEFVLFVGTVEPRKNLHRLVAAVAQLADQGRPLPLVVAGADGWGEVRSQLDAAGTDVRFLGQVSDADLRALYALAAVMAYPSEREGFGLPVAEAMAQGTAVVTSRGTSTEEVAGGAAVLVDPTDVDDIARGLIEALERRDELAAPSRQRASELSWKRSADATLAVYRELVL